MGAIWKPTRFLPVVFAALLAASGSLQASSYVWVGIRDVDASWFGVSNWDPDGVPTSNDTVEFDNYYRVCVISGGSAEAGPLYVDNGQLRIENGGVLNSLGGRIAELGGLTGIVTVNGNGSTWNVGGSGLQVARDGNGTLNIENGGVVNSTGGSIASLHGHGVVNVTGNSKWTINNPGGSLSVGNGTYWGKLTIQDGGSVSTGSIGTNVGLSSGGLGEIILGTSTGGAALLETAFVRGGAGQGKLVFNNGMLRATAHHPNFISAFDAGEVTIESGGAYIDSNGFDIGVHWLGGSGPLSKVSPGKLSLVGPGVTYTGNTLVQAGTLELKDLPLFNSAIAITNGATLELNTDLGDVALLQGVSGSGRILISGTNGTARLAGDNGGFSGSFSLPSNARGMMWSGPEAGSAEAGWELSGEFATIETGAGNTTTKLGALSGTNFATKLTTFGGSGVKTLEIGALNANTSFAGMISDNSQGGDGTAVVAVHKVGTGTLILAGNNSYSGGTTVSAGTLQVASGSGLPVNRPLTVNGGTFDLNGQTGIVVSSLSGANGTLALGSGILGILQTFDTTYSGAITGTGGITKAYTGGGSLSLSGPGITYTGPTQVEAGALEILNNTAFNSPINLTNYGSLVLNIADDVKLLQGIRSNQTGTIRVTGTVKTARLAGDNSGFEGKFSLPSNARGMMWSGPEAGSAKASWELSGEFAAIETGAGDTTTKLGELSGSNPATKLTTFGGSGMKVLEVGHLNTDSTFAGIMSDNSQGGNGTATLRLRKLGTGRLTLTGANTYTGLTAVNGGTLQVAGSISGNVVVNGSGKLEGAGTVGGNLLVQGATVSPGNDGIGKLTVGGAVTLAGDCTMLMELAGPASFDQLAEIGGITFNGTLQLSLIGSYQPLIGDHLQLFPNTTASDSGEFDAILFSEPGYAGSFDNTNGTLTITAVPEPSTCAFLGLALAGSALRRRRAKQ